MDHHYNENQTFTGYLVDTISENGIIIIILLDSWLVSWFIDWF